MTRFHIYYTGAKRLCQIISSNSFTACRASAPTEVSVTPTTTFAQAFTGSSWTQVASSVKGTSYKDTTVQKGVKYGYKVRGVAADGKTLSRTYNTDGLRATMP